MDKKNLIKKVAAKLKKADRAQNAKDFIENDPKYKAIKSKWDSLQKEFKETMKQSHNDVVSEDQQLLIDDLVNVLKTAKAEIWLGEEGLDNSYQMPFPKTTKCTQKGCGGEARAAFVMQEKFNKELGKKDKYITNIYSNKKDALWPHDSSAFAVYLCKKCLKPTALFNQA